MAASPDENGSYWRRPTKTEIAALDLDLTITEEMLRDGTIEIRWLIAVTGEPEIVRRKHAVRMVEQWRTNEYGSITVTDVTPGV